MSYYTFKRKARKWFWTILFIIAAGAFCLWRFVGFDKVKSTYDKARSVFRPSEPPSDTLLRDTLPPDTVYVGAWGDSVQLQTDGRHQYAEVDIDGVKVKRALFDTGCTKGLSGSIVVYRFLLANGNISPRGTSVSAIANGDTVKTYLATAYNVKVFNRRFDSVECAFLDTDDAPFLVGQGIISRLGRHWVDPKTGMLYLE